MEKILFKTEFKDILNELLNLFFPKTCLLCNILLTKTEKQICIGCALSIPRTNYHLLKDNPVEQLFWGKAKLEHGTSFFLYIKKSNYQQLIHALKYKNKPEVGHILGKYAAVDLQSNNYFDDVDVIIPVPLHKTKLAKRGYNQCEEIATGIGYILQKSVDTSSLIRIKATTTQTTKNVYDRFTNTNGVFAVPDSTNLTNKHVLLVDDVLTTGSTLEACIRAMEHIEGIRFSIFTLAIASRQ